jgi:lysophospholipase L1-like esterase
MLLSLIATAGCASLQPQTPRPVAAGSTYVSLGSSFAAGAGIGPLQHGAPPRCSRTVNNYASLLSQRLGLVLVDVACSGATTGHVLNGWDELAPQINAVTPRTALVTITVGGNDVGYVAGLFASSCRAGAAAFPGPCQTIKPPSDADFAVLQKSLVEIVKRVRDRAPQARVIFVQYVTLLPDKPCDLTVISQADLRSARRIAGRLAKVTRQAADAANAEVLTMDRKSRQHAPCAATPWSFGMSPSHDKAKGTPWHPNAAGHAASADQLSEMVASQR